MALKLLSIPRMKGLSILDVLMPLLFALTCGMGIQQLRTALRQRRIRRITARLLE